MNEHSRNQVNKIPSY